MYRRSHDPSQYLVAPIPICNYDLCIYLSLENLFFVNTAISNRFLVPHLNVMDDYFVDKNYCVTKRVEVNMIRELGMAFSRNNE